MKVSRLLVRFRPWLPRLQGALAAAIVLTMGVVIARRWDEVRAQDWQFAPLPLALSVVIVVAAIIVWALAWAYVVGRLGAVNQSVREVAGLYLYSNLARYLPGGVWNLVARAYLGHQHGLGQRRIWTATVMDLVVAIATGLLLYAVTAGSGGPAVVPPALCGLAGVLLLALVSPPALSAVERFRGGRASPQDVLSWRAYAAYLAISGVIWAGIGVAFFLFVVAIYPLEAAFLPAAIGLWSISVVAGLLAIGVPQGLGVKEALLVLGLSAVLPVPAATAIAVGSRIWMICCDLVAVGTWWSVMTLETVVRRAAFFKGLSRILLEKPRDATRDVGAMVTTGGGGDGSSRETQEKSRPHG